jgi:hypothetical protein
MSDDGHATKLEGMSLRKKKNSHARISIKGASAPSNMTVHP